MKFNILDLLLPRETKFYTYMNEQAEIFIKGCLVFKNLVLNLDAMNKEAIKNDLAKINQYEQEGDDIEHHIIAELHKTFITPLDREDIHLIAINLDKSLDILNSISRKMDIYGIYKVPSNVCKFADVIVEIALELRNLFSALKEKENINPIVKRMHELENKADSLFYTSVAELFHQNYGAVDIIKFKEVYEHLESIVDSVDFVGKIVRGIVVKQG
jgi:hypothetical protein